MKKILKYIGILLAVYLTVLTCNTLISKKIDEVNMENLKPYLEEQRAIRDVVNTTKRMNKKLPMVLGDGRTLMKMDYDDKKNTMTYNYKYAESIKDLNQEDINGYKDYWKKEVLQVSRKNPNNKHFVIAKVTFVYILLDINNVEVLRFIITPTEYK